MKKINVLDKLRLSPWLIAALIQGCIVGWVYPHQLGVLIWALTKLSAGGYLGYLLDRNIFYYARPGDFIDEKKPIRHCAYMLRRAIIMAAVIISLGLGV